MLIAYIVFTFTKNMIFILGIPLLILQLTLVSSTDGFRDKRVVKEVDVLNKTNYLDESMIPEPPVDADVGESSEVIPNASESTQLESIDNLNPADFETVPVDNIPNKHSPKKSKHNNSPKKSKHNNSPKSTNQVNYASTYMSNLKKYNDILGNDGLFKMTKHTKELMEQQNQLGESISKIVPLIQQMTPFLNTAGKLFNGNMAN